MHHGNFKQLKAEQGISQHLPYTTLETDDIILTQQEDRLRIWKVNGLPVDTADPGFLNEAFNQRMTLFTHLPYGQEFRIYHTLMRTSEVLGTKSNFHNPFGENFMHDYYKGFESKPLFTNNHYLSLLHRLPMAKRTRSIFTNHDKNRMAYQQRREQATMHIEEASKFIEQQLGCFGIRRLGNQFEKHEGMQFLSRLLNWQHHPVCPQPMEIRSYLPKVRLFFGERALEICDNTTQKSFYAAVIAVKGYATQTTWPGLLDGLLTLPCEFCLTQSFTLIPKQQAREQLTLHQRRLEAVDDPDLRGLSQLQKALGAVVAGDYALGWHQLSVMVVSEDLDQLEDKVAMVQHELLQAGLIPVRETLLMEPVYWSQFPGNHQYLFRELTLHSGNMACLASFHAKTIGSTKTHWGSPLILLRTPEQSSYWFNFHVKDRDVGDTLILGEKGCGKTLLLTTLATAALQYKSRIFYFDKDFGAENWIHAIQGKHVILGTGEKTGLNPLQLPDTSANRSFLKQWLRSLLEAFGPALNEEESATVHNAIQFNYEHLTKIQRTLSNLQTALGAGGPGSLRNRLQHWHSHGEYAFYFDNLEDNLAFDNSVYGFEMHYLLQDNQVHARFPVFIYLFHRIRLALETSDKRPTLIILDEAWALLANDYFAKEIKNWLLTLRKLNAITIFATQNPADILNNSITPILVAETVTKIIYRPNTPTETIYQNALHLTSGEYKALCQIPVASRAFLVKQPDHSVVAQLDLSDIPEYISILSSRPQHRDENLRQIKENPETWWTCVVNKILD